MSVSLPVPRFAVSNVLWLTQFTTDRTAVLVCRGYGDEDDEGLYTGIYWADDSETALGGDYDWYDFHLWLWP